MPLNSLNIVLFENIHPKAVEVFKKAELSNIQVFSNALDPESLKEAVKDAHIIGIRSKTKLTAEIFEAAPNLIAVACFCIGTNQVDLDAAADHGIPVFNAPYGNTRSVAEMVIGEIIMLMRRIPEKSRAAHEGQWLKTADGACEIRGKTLGIVGYGHIGSQVSVLAESLGMHVIYYDSVDKLALGNAKPAKDLMTLLAQSDVVSLHVPADPSTKDMVSAKEISAMKKGAYLINAARGNIVDLDALKAALEKKALAGAALDVFPKEPASIDDPFLCPLRQVENVILTPHIGGSTQEAQENIALDAADKLVRFLDWGTTTGAVNFPNIAPGPLEQGRSRFMHIHDNVPGILAKINDVFSSREINIAAQYLQTNDRLGYVVFDMDGGAQVADEIRQALLAIDGTITVYFQGK